LPSRALGPEGAPGKGEGLRHSDTDEKLSFAKNFSNMCLHFGVHIIFGIKNNKNIMKDSISFMHFKSSIMAQQLSTNLIMASLITLVEGNIQIDLI
jgi:hypothetical protein